MGLRSSATLAPAAVSSSEVRLPELFEDLKAPLSIVAAVAEAARCLECGGPHAQAPCIEACPSDVDVPGFVTAIYNGNNAEAAQIIFQQNLLGASCARVCPVEELCEGACVLKAEGRRPVEIGRLQRFAAEYGLKNRIALRDRAPESGSNGAAARHVAVIGAGPAGLSCAGELKLKGYSVTVYDKNRDFGGLVRYAIAPYRIRRDPIPTEVAYLKALGVDLRLGVDIDSKEKLQEIEAGADAVFLGIGLGEDVAVRYDGDELPGVWNSLDFIRAIKTGKPPAVGERVGVIGGGNTAIDVAREALRLGAHNVTLFYRRTEAQMPAYKIEIEEAREEGVHIQQLTNVVGFRGDYRLQEMELQYMKLGEQDGSGRPRPIAVPGSEFTVPVDTVIKAIGQQKRTGFLEWIDGVADESGLVEIDPDTGRTPAEKYFAGGDCLNGGGTVVEAVQHGKTVAAGIDRYLKDVER